MKYLIIGATGSIGSRVTRRLIWRAVREGRLAIVSDGVKRLIGREPIPFTRWAEENAAAFQ
jgi:uncharacterized protein YbjT (DUF2867 family)